jgi:hypothetical protein
LWLLQAAVPCCRFASRRFDHANSSSNGDYFGQGGVVLILTLAPPAPVVHGVSRVSAVFADADFSLISEQKVSPMTPWQNRVTDVTRRMADDMKLRNYSQKTIDAYTYHVGRFAEFLGKCPLEAAPEDV